MTSFASVPGSGHSAPGAIPFTDAREIPASFDSDILTYSDAGGGRACASLEGDLVEAGDAFDAGEEGEDPPQPSSNNVIAASAAQQRRNSSIGSIILIVSGALILIEGVQAMRSGELVNIGGFRTGFRAPWWKAVPFGMPVVVSGIWTAWPDSKRS
jgi:hypothetical protein